MSDLFGDHIVGFPTRRSNVYDRDFVGKVLEMQIKLIKENVKQKLKKKKSQELLQTIGVCM